MELSFQPTDQEVNIGRRRKPIPASLMHVLEECAAARAQGAEKYNVMSTDVSDDDIRELRRVKSQLAKDPNVRFTMRLSVEVTDTGTNEIVMGAEYKEAKATPPAKGTKK